MQAPAEILVKYSHCIQRLRGLRCRDYLKTSLRPTGAVWLPGIALLAYEVIKWIGASGYVKRTEFDFFGDDGKGWIEEK